jgi:hypothetical protein
MTNCMGQGTSWVLNGCLTGQTFFVLMEPPRFSIKFQIYQHYSLSWDRWVQSTSLYALYLRSIIKYNLPIYILGLPSSLFSLGISIKILHELFFCRIYLLGNRLLPSRAKLLWTNILNYENKDRTQTSRRNGSTAVSFTETTLSLEFRRESSGAHECALPNAMFEWLSLLANIWEMPDLYLGPESDYPKSLYSLLLFTLEKYRDSTFKQVTTPSTLFPILHS